MAMIEAGPAKTRRGAKATEKGTAYNEAPLRPYTANDNPPLQLLSLTRFVSKSDAAARDAHL